MTIQLPLTLKKQLVDDWDYVTQQKKVIGFSHASCTFFLIDAVLLYLFGVKAELYI